MASPNLHRDIILSIQLGMNNNDLRHSLHIITSLQYSHDCSVFSDIIL